MREMTACHECDLLLDCAPVANETGSAVCPRCGAELYRADPGSLERSLALTCAALILLVLANAFPFVGLNIHGQQIETTLFGTARQLWLNDMPLVAFLLMATVVVMPMIELGAMAWLLAPLHFKCRVPGFVPLFRALQWARPWAMVEVFILGVLVALVKLSHLAYVLPGTAIWCFGGLMLVLAALSVAFDPRTLWQMWEKS